MDAPEPLSHEEAIDQLETLLDAIEREYREREISFQAAKKAGLSDQSVLAELGIMNAIQRIRYKAGLPLLIDSE